MNGVLIGFLMLLFNFSIKAQTNDDSLRVLKLNLNDVRIEAILNKLNVAVEEGDGKSEKFFVIRSKKFINYYELRFSVLHKNDFDWFLLNKKDKLQGYFLYKKVNVLVFGDINNMFKLSDHFKPFNFIKLQPNRDEVFGDKEPPIIFEPLIWIYIIKNKKIKFLSKGRYYLLR
ncbi:hypothetical protein [Pedobacter psychrodurus]|uniref:hypothetical protein n=1 Tax=Pedobacter psychrodurus TaxID=2530456 RepID=UPI002931D797|nr:hypothetical protein [Pedobacter psychrodurus]